MFFLKEQRTILITLKKSTLCSFCCQKKPTLLLLIVCHQCFIVMSETGISIFMKSRPRSKILMVLHVAFLLCGWFLILCSVFQSEKSKWDGEDSHLPLTGKQQLLSFPLFHVFHIYLWIIVNLCILNLFYLYYVYTGTSMLWRWRKSCVSKQFSAPNCYPW